MNNDILLSKSIITMILLNLERSNSDMFYKINNVLIYEARNLGALVGSFRNYTIFIGR